MENEFYKTYNGPNLLLVMLGNVDFTNKFKELYGNENNWNKKIYKVSDVFNEDDLPLDKDLVFIFEYKSYVHASIKNVDTIINPPLMMPFDMSLYATCKQDIWVDYANAFRLACINGHFTVAERIQLLNSHMFQILYNEDGSYKGYYIRDKEEDI